MPDNPLFITMDGAMAAAGLVNAVETVSAALSNNGLSSLRYEISGESSALVGTPASLIDKLKNTDYQKRTIFNVRFILNDDFDIVVRRDPDGGGWKLGLNLICSKMSPALYASLMDKVGRVCLELFRCGVLQMLQLTRKETGQSCVPSVPIAKVFPLVLTTDEEVAEKYFDPAAFWNAGWDVVERRGTMTLLRRALTVFESSIYLSQVMAFQWQMARAAKPRQVEYFAPQPTAALERLFYGGAPTLMPVAHIGDGNIVEYSCCIPDTEHLRGWEIYQLRSVIRDGRLESGLPVKTVRVVFCRRELAQREKRPLLDIGARVYYQSDEDIVEIEA